jgi:hypothetical protein
MQKDWNAFDHPSHLKMGQALEEVCAHSGAFLGCGAELGVLQILPCPLLDQGGHQGACQAEEQTKEHEDVCPDCNRRGCEGALRRQDNRRGRGSIRLGLNSDQLSEKRYRCTAVVRQKSLVCLNNEGRNDCRK